MKTLDPPALYTVITTLLYCIFKNLPPPVGAANEVLITVDQGCQNNLSLISLYVFYFYCN